MRCWKMKMFSDVMSVSSWHWPECADRTITHVSLRHGGPCYHIELSQYSALSWTRLAVLENVLTLYRLLLLYNFQASIIYKNNIVLNISHAHWRNEINRKNPHIIFWGDSLIKEKLDFSFIFFFLNNRFTITF